jgi:hypothetical protein
MKILALHRNMLTEHHGKRYNFKAPLRFIGTSEILILRHISSCHCVFIFPDLKVEELPLKPFAANVLVTSLK